jgi:hypothetical protein
VQEVGAAQQLQVRWGAESESWDRFFQDVVRPYQASEIAPAMKMFEQREGRFDDNFLLANLMEAYQESPCKEPRDKVYGYVGIAHDCQYDSFLSTIRNYSSNCTITLFDFNTARLRSMLRQLSTSANWFSGCWLVPKQC